MVARIRKRMRLASAILRVALLAFVILAVIVGLAVVGLVYDHSCDWPSYHAENRYCFDIQH